MIDEETRRKANSWAKRETIKGRILIGLLIAGFVFLTVWGALENADSSAGDIGPDSQEQFCSVSYCE